MYRTCTPTVCDWIHDSPNRPALPPFSTSREPGRETLGCFIFWLGRPLVRRFLSFSLALALSLVWIPLVLVAGTCNSEQEQHGG